MDDQLRAFQKSLSLHAIMLLLFIVIGNFHPPKERTLVIDFTLEEPVVSRGYQSMPAARDRGNKPKSTELPDAKRKLKTPVPEKEEELPSNVQTVRQVSSIDRQSTTFRNNENGAHRETLEAQTSGIKPLSDTIANILPSGNGKAKLWSSGVPADAPDSGKAGYLKAHFSYIRDLINRKIIYPPSARHNGWEGKVRVSFTILSDGDVRNIRVVQSSGREILDRNALDAVKSASPFPKPPAEAQIIIPILYRLN